MKLKETMKQVKLIGYIDYISSIVTPLYIILPQMSGWIKYFENGGKNVSFKIEDESVYLKYSEIWNKIKKIVSWFKIV